MISLLLSPLFEKRLSKRLHKHMITVLRRVIELIRLASFFVFISTTHKKAKTKNRAPLTDIKHTHTHLYPVEKNEARKEFPTPFFLILSLSLHLSIYLWFQVRFFFHSTVRVCFLCVRGKKV